MTAFDYILIGFLLICVVLSAIRGFVTEGISLAGWVIAFWAALQFSDKVAGWISGVISGETAQVIIAFILIFIAVRIAAMLVAKLMKATLKAAGLSLMDRLLGAAFGLLKGLLISFVVISLCMMTSIPQKPFWKNAKFSPAAEWAVGSVYNFLPGYLRQKILY